MTTLLPESNTSAERNHEAGLSYLMMKSSLEQFGVIYSELKSEQLPKVTRQAVHAHRLQRKVLASAEASQVHLNQGEVEQAVAELAKRFAQQQDFAATLAANQLDSAQLRQALHDELKCQAVLNYVGLRAGQCSEQQALAYYQSHPEKFSQPERRYARHILITVNDDFAENTLDQVELRIADIYQQLQRKGHYASHFGWFAKRYSECPSAMNDGELGWVEPNILFAELDQALFTMESGQISEPIATEAGLHLLYCQQISAAHTVAFEQAKDKICQTLTAHASKREQKRWLSQLS
ncbi:nitrogen fixation protein NifM [Neiella sp. HB171785]|uniref:peptidylprolyl isomerase n=1 Tax=Neiella litorisoli TaxID=2771431 RepID=A0A8J6QM77_9GAMM|nr:nitrogen fixation protein NifM [Neiella litorisoli]MBD1390716.1 nitrogen fixation protein NifM [Neiella litorisoli]